MELPIIPSFLLLYSSFKCFETVEKNYKSQMKAYVFILNG